MLDKAARIPMLGIVSRDSIRIVTITRIASKGGYVNEMGDAHIDVKLVLKVVPL